MAKRFKTFADLESALKSASLKTQNDVRGTLEFYLGRIEDDAKRDAPHAGSKIDTEHGEVSQAEIKPEKSWTPIDQAIGYRFDAANYKGTVYVERSAGDIAAWVEFGTGQSAARYLTTVPSEWRSLAQLYYVNGKGTIINQPYLLPAFLRNQVLFKEELKSHLKNITF